MFDRGPCTIINKTISSTPVYNEWVSAAMAVPHCDYKIKHQHMVVQVYRGDHSLSLEDHSIKEKTVFINMKPGNLFLLNIGRIHSLFPKDIDSSSRHGTMNRFRFPLWISRQWGISSGHRTVFQNELQRVLETILNRYVDPDDILVERGLQWFDIQKQIADKEKLIHG